MFSFRSFSVGALTDMIDDDSSDPQVACRFNNTIVNGTIVEGGAYDTLQCVSPPSAVGVAEVEVAVNGRDFSKSGLTFYYQSQLQLAKLHPRSGSIRGTRAAERRPRRPRGLPCSL